ncbi:magnesium/cobalt transporter CorA [bacterium]|nr:magnesium/cobalt transporter CorA [bacterium]NCQ55148.1 magnesium/cobalt transporter CorA [Candidatus Parcubacteria bacterium]NCS67339.1 magnesium/cobalt transporter CorA [Candidatus Peregrinibacteria bacterium]NCS96594.1 magnesium/cobalt transporter CorA [bacterium]
MKKLVTNSVQHIGNSPGTLSYSGVRHSQKVQLSYWENSPGKSLDLTLLDNSEIPKTKDINQWINVQGLNDIDVLKSLGDQFGIHPLFLEDILNPGQRPKVETIGDCLLVSLRALSFDETKQIRSFPVTFVLTGTALFSFSELEIDDWLNPILKRLKNPSGALQQKSIHYILYALIDVLVDQYFSVLEGLGDQIQSIDENIFKNSDSSQLDALYQLKKQLLYFNKQASPVPEFIRKMPNELPEKQWKAVKIYFDDLLDHSMQVQDITKTYLESMNNLFDLYFSLVNLKMNRTIQALTVITVVFLPLTLLAGIYGMNFTTMPGLYDDFAFWWMIIGMLCLSILILWFLKRKQWF